MRGKSSIKILLIGAMLCLGLAACQSNNSTKETPKQESNTEINKETDVTAADETGQEEVNNPDDKTEANLKLASEDIDHNDNINLAETKEILNQYKIAFDEVKNVSGERVDVLAGKTSFIFLYTMEEIREQDNIMEAFSNAELSDEDYVLIMKDTEFRDAAFQEKYLCQYDVTTDEEYYPDTVNELLTEDFLLNKNQTDLSIMRNQIFARHGRIFMDPFLNAVFQRKSWYKPLYNEEMFATLGDTTWKGYEKENLELIIGTEKKLEYR